MTKKIFISYSRSDAEFADRLVDSFKRSNILTWIDKNTLRGGQQWVEEIEKGIDGSDYIVVILSPEAVSSEWVKTEYVYAKGQRKTIIPILLHPVKVPMALSNYQLLEYKGKFDSLFSSLLISIEVKLPTPDILLPQVITPSLVVLLGTTAAWSAYELQKQLLSLSQADRSRVAFIYIDADDTFSEMMEFRIRNTGKFTETRERISVPSNLSSFEIQNHAIASQTFISPYVPKYYASGAGGIRNNGHMAVAFNQSQIRALLSNVYESVTRLNENQITQNSQYVQEIQVNVVAFIGSGFGGGTLPHFAILIRDILNKFSLSSYRLNLFCLLPGNYAGISGKDKSWRNANSMATLLELVALGLASKSPDQSYRKFLLNEEYDIPFGPIANEIYLIQDFGHNTASGIARNLGMDLYQRIVDGTGIGLQEHSKWVDRKILATNDNKGLPKVFGKTIPFRVSFSLEESASAFASIASSYFMKNLIKQINKAQEATSSDIVEEYLTTWQNVARITTSTRHPYYIKPPIWFQEIDFLTATLSTFDYLWEDLQLRCRTIEEDVKNQLAILKRDEETKLIAETYLDNEDISKISLLYLHSINKKREYDLVHEWMKGLPIVPRPTERPYKIEKKYFNRYIKKTVPDQMDIAKDLVNYYNNFLSQFALHIRMSYLLEIVVSLKPLVDTAFEMYSSLYKHEQAEAITSKLYSDCINNPAWQGKTSYPTPLSRNFFDQARFYRLEDNINFAVQKLFTWCTTNNDEYFSSQPSLDSTVNFEEMIFYRAFRRAFFDHIRNTDSRPNEQSLTRFFYEIYKSSLKGINLFDLLQIVGIENEEEISEILSSHLLSLGTDLSPHQPFLYENAPDVIKEYSVYLSINWKNERQRNIIQKVIENSALLSYKTTGVNPIVIPTDALHSLDVSIGEHGLSLSEIKDFSYEVESTLADYLFYQRQWLGIPLSKELKNIDNPSPSYGHNSLPLHSSSEMERLIWKSGILGFPDSLIEKIAVTHLPMNTNLFRD